MPQFSADSREVYFLEGGRRQSIGVDNRQTHPVNVTAEMDVDFNQEKMAVFEQAWAAQRDNYADPNYNGVDWNAVRKTYAPLIEGAHNPDEMRRHPAADDRRAEFLALRNFGSGRGARRRGAAQWDRSASAFDRATYESTGKAEDHGGAAAFAGGPGEDPAGRGAARGGRRGDRAARQPGRAAASTRSGKRVVLDISGPAGDGAARGIARRPDLPQVGGGQPRVRREDQQQPARVRAPARHVGAGAGPALPGSRCGEPRAPGRDHRHPQQQRRLRQRLRPGRAVAAAVPDHDQPQRPAGIRRARLWGSARSSCRPSWW